MLSGYGVDAVRLLAGVLKFLHEIRNIIHLLPGSVQRALQSIAVPLVGHEAADLGFEPGQKLPLKQITAGDILLRPFGKLRVRPLAGAVLILAQLQLIQLLRAVRLLQRFFHIPDRNAVLVHPYFLGQKIIPLVDAVEIQIDHAPAGDIAHIQLRRQLQNNLVAKPGLIITVGQKVPGFRRAEPEEIRLPGEPDPVRLFGEAPGGIPPSADALHPASVECCSGRIIENRAALLLVFLIPVHQLHAPGKGGHAEYGQLGGIQKNGSDLKGGVLVPGGQGKRVDAFLRDSTQNVPLLYQRVSDLNASSFGLCQDKSFSPGKARQKKVADSVPAHPGRDLKLSKSARRIQNFCRTQSLYRSQSLCRRIPFLPGCIFFRTLLLQAKNNFRQLMDSGGIAHRRPLSGV